MFSKKCTVVSSQSLPLLKDLHLADTKYAIVQWIGNKWQVRIIPLLSTISPLHYSCTALFWKQMKSTRRRGSDQTMDSYSLGFRPMLDETMRVVIADKWRNNICSLNEHGGGLWKNSWWWGCDYQSTFCFVSFLVMGYWLKIVNVSHDTCANGTWEKLHDWPVAFRAL